jgi:NAD(P)H-hydrate epimerase
MEGKPRTTFPAITVAQMREVDRLMIEEYGIALLQMMENAGRGLAGVARQWVGGDMASKRVVVLVGSGNNGGGGLVAARHLANAGAQVTVALTHAPPLPGEVPEHQRRALERMQVAGSDRATSVPELQALLTVADLVLDALLGYSLRGVPREPVASFIRAANAAQAAHLALDLPSGLDGDSGVPSDPTLRAGATLTLAWPKAGLLAPGAQSVVGEVYLADISVPEAVYRPVGVERGDLFARSPIVRVKPATGGWEPDEAGANAADFE